MKKLINDPNQVAWESLEGMALAHPHLIKKLEGLTSVARADAPVAGKVTVLTGGGSGHDPLFMGYVGPGWPDASVAGNIFAAPPGELIYNTAKAVHGGRGILFLYGNYSGDILNFDMAAEMLEEDGIPVKTVRITDDVASAPPDRRDERRGIAGDIFVVKVAGAKSEERGDLDELAATVSHANDRTRSMGIALSSCIIPASGRPIFDISETEMEIGMGVHGEPGVERGPLRPADDVAANLIRRLLADKPEKPGSEVAVLVNGFGATPLGELYIIFRAAKRLLEEAGVSVFRSYVGNYATSLDMAGGSISLLWLDEELKRLLIAPAQSPGMIQV